MTNSNKIKVLISIGIIILTIYSYGFYKDNKSPEIIRIETSLTNIEKKRIFLEDLEKDLSGRLNKKGLERDITDRKLIRISNNYSLILNELDSIKNNLLDLDITELENKAELDRLSFKID